MLVFLDESYEEVTGGGFRHAYAGFGIHELEYRGLVAAVHQCKLRYFRQSAGMTPEEIRTARATHIVTAEPPEDAEVKAAKLLTAKQANHHARCGNAPGVLMVDSLLDALARGQGTVFGMLSHLDDLRDAQDSGGRLPNSLCWLLERIELWMQEQHPASAAIIVPDTVHEGIDRQLSKRIADFLFRSAQGKRMRHVVPNPFWVDSSTTAGSQLADVTAHILMNGMRPPAERKQLTDLWKKVGAMEFRSLDLRTRGIRRVQKKQQTGAEAH